MRAYLFPNVHVNKMQKPFEELTKPVEYDDITSVFLATDDIKTDVKQVEESIKKLLGSFDKHLQKNAEKTENFVFPKLLKHQIFENFELQVDENSQTIKSLYSMEVSENKTL